MADGTEPEHGTPEWFRFALSHHMRDGRCSSCLIDQFAAGWESRDLDFHAIANGIGLLEEHPDACQTNTKPAAPLKGKLRGFHHKHYFQASFLMHNISAHWFKPNDPSASKLEKFIQKTIINPEIPPDARMNYILHGLVVGGLENRSREKRLTGEWIVYKRYGRVNYFLTLAKHMEPEEHVIDRLKSCAADFPELAPDLSKL